ncbi:uncharacterized protein F5891DRAFT_1279930 [Suillus fuscotomentosus]|uniref:Uncharacterized protein n=1 Tax=Suillus fuscotomentosus TaxID=1912939 RepID=A0AAD4E0W3_9AGAM|nr:uncharacterized protein F5891DRAFT_1279930 [Suillus fuscotomentosus]KAG1897698.1 hypothetical protein F5891DRAFT_1279930 [Suillus fuscotomentosus]
MPTPEFTYRQPSIFSFLSAKQRRATALTQIRKLVSVTDGNTPSGPSSSVAKWDITAAELSNLLQTRNIEGHTAPYWATVNHRQEVRSAFTKLFEVDNFKFSPECSSDLRLACMRTSNHTLFSDLKLQNTNAKNESLRLFLGCQPDKVTDPVDNGGDNHQFIVSFDIEKFQKRLCTTRELNYEFVARGRIWRFSFNVGPEGKWVASCGLSSPSLPACARSSLRLETHTTGRGTPRKVHKDEGTEFKEIRAPKGMRLFFVSLLAIQKDGQCRWKSQAHLLGIEVERSVGNIRVSLLLPQPYLGMVIAVNNISRHSSPLTISIDCVVVAIPMIWPVMTPYMQR